MGALSGELRGQLERSIVAARDEAERAAQAALETLGVRRREAYPGISDEDRQIRVQLRARARQLGEGDFEAGINPLVEEIAYQGWHRMLFARFLAENKLLMHPSGAAVTLQECAELAQEEDEPDAWMVAARYAGAMLPGIFRQDDPSSRVRFAPEGRNALERILNDLPSAVFAADDALGWVYQFWQSKAKKAVNDSGVKIGAKELPAVTQLFTEDYMVRFLLENSLGAWWSARHPQSPLIKEWEYLRFEEDGTPAAGRFESWPERAARVPMMDPCCGSGHFLVAAFDMLRKMRMEEEGLSALVAGNAVLRDNVHGLEIDLRCTQIAAFALAFTAWKAGGYRQLPSLNVTCSGSPVKGQLEEWTKLAGRDTRLRFTLEGLHSLFSEAPTLGSLIDPNRASGSLFSAHEDQVRGALHEVLGRVDDQDDMRSSIFGLSAAGAVEAGELLGGQYDLIATNVPYLGYKKQAEPLKRLLEVDYPDGKMDLATAFITRCRTLTRPEGHCALVTPQNWLFLGSYRRLRERYLREQQWKLVAWLGAGAFSSISGEVVKPALLLIGNSLPSNRDVVHGADVSLIATPKAKANHLRQCVLLASTQMAQLQNPESRIAFTEDSGTRLLEKYAVAPRGIVTGDSELWVRKLWEIQLTGNTWFPLLGPVSSTRPYGGREHIINWSTGGRGMLRPGVGNVAYGKCGVAVNRMSSLACTLYTGQLYDQSVAVVTPTNAEHLAAIWAFCASYEYGAFVRRVDRKLGVTPATLLKVPFDLERWQKVAEETGPLPEPYSNDPTQWLFKSDPADSTEPLQVAVAKLLGYRWPEQEEDHLSALPDEDGIVPLVPILKEQPAAERLRVLLAEAFGDAWSTNKQDALLSQVGYGGKDLGTWLRDGFFPQHAKSFHNRPFIWQIWDGTRDGFSVLVNYHTLDTATLERLIYTYLGSWIDRQRGERDAGVAGAEGRLVAALSLQKKLVAIREGEPPYDIYVRWKPLHEQPIGWDPDLNDGVRLNIRPFVTARVLRSKFTINWNKDRGTNPDGLERLNDLHLTLAEKYAARAAAGVA